MAKEQIFSDCLNMNIEPEMRDRLNRLNAERYGGYASTAALARDLLNWALTGCGYPKQPQGAPTIPPTMPPTMQSPFQQPMTGINGR